jgi:DNA double-strand break repair helicase HerA and related ATPase
MEELMATTEQAKPDQEDFDGVPGSVIGRVVCLAETPSLRSVVFRLRPEATTTAGKLVAIEGKDHQGRSVLVLSRVSDIFDHNPHEDPLSSTVQDVIPFPTKYAAEGHSTVIYRAAKSEPLEEALVTDDGQIEKIRSVETLVRAGASVFEAGPDLMTGALGLEPDPDKGLEVGTIHGTDVKVVLKKETIQRHMFIAGGIGTGKSYTRGVVGEELHAWGVPQINIDVNGEMIEATKQLGGANLLPGKNGFTLPLSALTSGDVIEAIPGINRSTNIAVLIEYAHERLVKEKTLSKGEHFGVKELVDAISQYAPDLKMDAAGTLRPAVLRAQSLEKIPYIGSPFDWENQLKPGAVINIDCRGLLISDLRLIAAAIARDLQRLAKANKIPFVVFSIDEFHLVAPNDDAVVTTQVLREIARIGRHYRIGLILTTQSPSDVDRAILKRLLTRFLHAIEPDQLDALRGVFSDASAELIQQLPKLPIGTCIVTGATETVKHATVIDIRKRHTIHGGQTPDVWADFAKRGWTGKKKLEV